MADNGEKKHLDLKQMNKDIERRTNTFIRNYMHIRKIISCRKHIKSSGQRIKDHKKRFCSGSRLQTILSDGVMDKVPQI